MPKITEKRIKALEAAIRDPLVPQVSVDAITDLIADYRAERIERLASRAENIVWQDRCLHLQTERDQLREFLTSLRALRPPQVLETEWWREVSAALAKRDD